MKDIVFKNNGSQICFGDALHVLKENVADSSVDLIFADPPYNIGKNFNGRMDKWPSDEAYLSAILDEIVKQSKVEFNYLEETEVEIEEDEETGFSPELPTVE